MFIDTKYMGTNTPHLLKFVGFLWSSLLMTRIYLTDHEIPKLCLYIMLKEAHI